MTEAKAAKKPNPALAKPLQPSNELAAVVGSTPLPRTEVVSKVWEYIKANNLQNPANKREILADDKLRAVFARQGQGEHVRDEQAFRSAPLLRFIVRATPRRVRIVKLDYSDLLVPGALRICPNNLHSPQCLELALAESPYPLGRGLFMTKSLLAKCRIEPDSKKMSTDRGSSPPVQVQSEAA